MSRHHLHICKDCWGNSISVGRYAHRWGQLSNTKAWQYRSIIIFPSRQSCQVMEKTIYISVTVYRLLFSVLSSITLCQQQPGFCSDAVVLFCLSGFDVIIVCLRARDTEDYLKSDMSSQSIRTERQKSNSNGISNHLQMWFRSYLQKSHFMYFWLPRHPKVDLIKPKNGSELAGWTYASSQAGLFWTSAF